MAYDTPTPDSARGGWSPEVMTGKERVLRLLLLDTRRDGCHCTLSQFTLMLLVAIHASTSSARMGFLIRASFFPFIQPVEGRTLR